MGKTPLPAKALRARLEILDRVRGQLLCEITRAERGLPSLLRADGEALISAPNWRAALAIDEKTTAARKHLREALVLLSPKIANLSQTGRTPTRRNFDWGFEEALLLLVMTDPADDPRKRRDEILVAAHEQGISRTEVRKAAGIASEEAHRQALTRGKKKRGT